MRFLVALTFALAALSAAFAQTTTSEQEQQPQQPQQPNLAWLRFGHAWPQMQAVDVWIDDNTTPIWNWIPFRHVTSYVPMNPGQHRMVITRASEFTTGNLADGQAQNQLSGIELQLANREILLDITLDLQNQYYSFVFWNISEEAFTATTSSSARQEPQQILDQFEQQRPQFETKTQRWALFVDLNRPIQGQSVFRAINLINMETVDSLNVFLESQQQQQLQISDVQFSNASSYMLVQPGLYRVRFQSIDNGNQADLFTIDNVDMMPDRVYSMFVMQPLPDSQEFSGIMKFDSWPLLQAGQMPNLGQQ